MQRVINAIRPVLESGGVVVGLEPSCLLTFRDEAPRLFPDWDEALGSRVMLFEEYLSPVQKLLARIPGLEVETVETSCCGMAGSFGYQAETVEVSRTMGELNLLPAVRAADRETLVVADGTSCREQIAHGAGREALHAARVLLMAVEAGREAAK